MRTALECIPCFARQALEAGRFATDDPEVHERLVRMVLRMAAEMDLSESPPAIGQRVHRELRRLTGVADPYRELKERFNGVVLDILPELRGQVEGSGDRLGMAVRLAIAGNVIDLGVNGGITDDEARGAIYRAMEEPFAGELDGFREAVETAGEILYLADNAGEIVLDRLLIEQLGPGRVTVAVRGGAVLNDVTRADAEAVGLEGLVEVIDNGSDAPGTILEDCSAEFRRRFAEADLVIAKGQGNFETLSEAAGEIWFLFKVKCPVVAADVRLPVGTQVLGRRAV